VILFILSIDDPTTFATETATQAIAQALGVPPQAVELDISFKVSITYSFDVDVSDSVANLTEAIAEANGVSVNDVQVYIVKAHRRILSQARRLAGSDVQVTITQRNASAAKVIQSNSQSTDKITKALATSGIVTTMIVAEPPRVSVDIQSRVTRVTSEAATTVPSHASLNVLGQKLGGNVQAVAISNANTATSTSVASASSTTTNLTIKSTTQGYNASVPESESALNSAAIIVVSAVFFLGVLMLCVFRYKRLWQRKPSETETNQRDAPILLEDNVVAGGNDPKESEKSERLEPSDVILEFDTNAMSHDPEVLECGTNAMSHYPEARTQVGDIDQLSQSYSNALPKPSGACNGQPDDSTVHWSIGDEQVPSKTVESI